MSTTTTMTREKQWLQIYERQRWIINQAKQQSYLFDQDLASKLLIDGIAPPPWLLSSADPTAHVLDHHELISGFSLPRGRPGPFTGSHCSVFDKPAATAHHTYGLCTGNRGLNRGGNVGDEVSDSPNCLISNGGCASNGVAQDRGEGDPSVTSPVDERNGRVSDVYCHSTSTPATGAGEGVSNLPQCDINYVGCVSDGGVSRDQKEHNPGGMSPQDQRDANVSDSYHDPDLSLARVQRSKSRQRALAIRNSTQKGYLQDKDNASGYAGETIKCGISVSQSENVDEWNDNHSVVEKPKIGEYQSLEIGTDVYSGRMTRSRSSGQQGNSSNVSGSSNIGRRSGDIAIDSIDKSTPLSNHLSQPLKPVSYSQTTNGSCREGESNSGDFLSKEKQTVRRDSMFEKLEREECSTKAIQESQGCSISQEDAEMPTVSRIPDDATHVTEGHHMVETSESSPELQKKEGGMALEGAGSCANALATFKHEETGSPVLSSLIDQAAGHHQDSLMGETRDAQPTSSNSDGGSQCTKEKSLVHLPFNSTLENAEDLSCAGNMKAKNLHFGGISNFFELLGGSHIKYSQLENVDELIGDISERGKKQMVELQSKEKGTDIYSGRITRTRSCGHQENSLKVSGSPCIDRISGGTAVDIGNLEEFCLKGLSTPASKKMIQGTLSVMMPLSFMQERDKPEEGITTSTHENPNSYLEMNLLGNSDVLVKEMEAQSSLVEALEEESSKSRRVSNGNVVSFVEEPFNSLEDAVANTFLECGESPKQKCYVIGDRPPLHVDWDGFTHSSVKEVQRSILSTAKAAKPIKLVSEDCAVESDALCSPQISIDVKFTMVSGPGTYRTIDTGNLEVENPYATSRDEMRSNLAQSSISHVSPKYEERSACDDSEVGRLESTEFRTTENSRGISYCYSIEGTSSKHKLRKIEDKRVHDLSASGPLTLDVFQTVKKDSVCPKLEGHEHSPEGLRDFQVRLASQDNDRKSNNGMSPVKETHLNEDDMVEMSEFSLEAQKQEGEMGMEGMDSSPNAPFTFLHEEIEALVYSSLPKQASGHLQDSLMEETGVTHPTSINKDVGSQCLKENPFSLHLQDDLRLEHAGNLSWAGRPMQAERDDFKETSKFSELSAGTPLVKSLDLVSADNAMPVLEKFVMKTDDEPHSIAVEGISYDEWNLSKTVVERASILEQLCKSACMQTPVAYSSASYKLNKASNLLRSVPTRVLEHVDPSTTLPLNDSVNALENGFSCWKEEVGPAFCGRSNSDCLPSYSGQSLWDIKKPYSSPVGKLWDRVSTSSSSSGKRVSSIPELPCISEENENIGEVADTFQDGIVSAVLDSSTKRPPLADITDIPNPPASVLKAVPYADRFSLDSVNTEFNLTGTHKSVKKKLGRRFNNKENQSISRGTKDTERATGSLQNRSSRPNFPGKTSLRNGGPSFSELEPKRNNIVSNISSFIPLVLQKQAAAALPGKRDIKVKALEAAEAAKRLAERKDNERKMKKEAMKVERARVEQENLRKLELQRKTKEEERKKTEADMAAKKRQREEDDRKEKHKKRMRVEEGRRDQREHEEKLRAEKGKKEIKGQAIDGRGRQSKDAKGSTFHNKVDNERKHDTFRSISEIDPRSSCVSATNSRRGSAVHEEYHEEYNGLGNVEHTEKVQCDSVKATENEKLVPNTGREQSYEISPYKESDDENEEDDDSIVNNKFIPSWASKNCLALDSSRQSRLYPEAFFPPESFCNVSEVLLPRKYQIQ